MGAHHGVEGALRHELVRRGHEGFAGQLRDLLRDVEAEPLRRVQAGADRGAADGQFVEAAATGFDRLDAGADLRRVSGPFLARP